MDLKRTVLGLELGSTRIKAVLLDENHTPLASGSFRWENKLVNGVWTYAMEEIHTGLQACFRDLAADVEKKLGQKLTTAGAMGISAMMHGYLPFDKDLQPLTPFRTWRNTMTEEAAKALSEAFHFHVPQRWSIAHLYREVLRKEPYLPQLDYLTTLSGYIHLRLTGKRVLGIGDASGMFPIDSQTMDYDSAMEEAFNSMVREYPWQLRDIFPKVLAAGEDAGALTKEGARFLDPTGTLQPGIPMAPPEGDAATGMTATNSVRLGTGNVSAGTSAFSMLVMDRRPGVHEQIDMVTTPAGRPVALVHCANCTTEINAWVELLRQFSSLMGHGDDTGEIFTRLFRLALEGAPDCSGILSYSCHSGEHIMGLSEGRPLLLRKPESEFTLANFMRAQLMSALVVLKAGLTILTEEEHIKIERLFAHGGFFRTPGVGERILSAATGAPVSVMKTAGEGGPYGMALLAAYTLWREPGRSLEDYLDRNVFAHAEATTVMASQEDIDGFDRYCERYCKAIAAERAAVETT